MTKNSNNNQTPVIRRKLTPEQQKMVEDNHNLIYSFMASHKLRDDAMDDWYGVCAIGLCQAALAWRPDKGVTFATFAYRCMQNCVGQVKRHNQNQIQPLSLDAVLSVDEWGNENTMYEFLSDVNDTEDDAVAMTTIQHALSQMKDDEVRVIEDWVNGLTTRESGKTIGASRTTVSTIRAKFIRLVKEEVASRE